MRKLLLVIDVQNDFINDNTRNYVSKIKSLIDSNNYEEIAFTKFINDEESIWVKDLNYKGCISEFGRKIVFDTGNNKIFEKKIYSALNDEFKDYVLLNSIDQIYLCGFDTDACIQKTALDLFENCYDVFILKDFCMSHSGVFFHNIAINNLKRLIGEKRII